MSVRIGHASKDEKGTLKNGIAGDQTGKEVYIREWYSRPWNYVIRAKSYTVRELIAICMEKACMNNNIGYDQNQRNTLLTQARKVGYDPSRVTVPCETDCSALVSLCCMYAGISEYTLTISGNSLTTSTLRKKLKDTGLFYVYNTSDYVSKSDNLMRGDILLYEGHHVAVALDNGSKVIAQKNTTNVKYYPKYNGSSSSIVTALLAVGEKDTTLSNRKKIASANGISNYNGTSEQNLKMVGLLKSGTLKKN